MPTRPRAGAGDAVGLGRLRRLGRRPGDRRRPRADRGQRRGSDRGVRGAAGPVDPPVRGGAALPPRRRPGRLRLPEDPSGQPVPGRRRCGVGRRQPGAGRAEPGRLLARGDRRAGRGTGRRQLRRGHVRAGAGQAPGGRPVPGPPDRLRRRFGRTHGGRAAHGRSDCRGAGSVRPAADGLRLVQVRLRGGVASRAHGALRHGVRRRRHGRVLRLGAAPRAWTAVGPDWRRRQRRGSCRPLRLRAFRQAADRLAQARRRRRADRALAGRGGPSDRGAARRRRGRTPRGQPDGQPRRVGCRHRSHDRRQHERLPGEARWADAPVHHSLRRLGGQDWLPAYTPRGGPGGAPRYTVISGDGEWLGTVEAPPRFRILDVAGGLVLGVQLDDMDVENVVVYELRPTSP